MGDRYWIMMLLDVWNDVPSAPGSRTVGGKGGDFLIVGPNWKGEAPEGLRVHRISSNLGNITGRTFTTGSAEDIAIVHTLQNQYMVRNTRIGRPGRFMPSVETWLKTPCIQLPGTMERDRC